MYWKENQIPNDDEGNPMFEGSILLSNDKNEKLGAICWFYENGPFYSYAMDVNQISVMRRIGPVATLEGAKQSIINALEGRFSLSNRAGYPRK
jgi:hypothetical protein